MGIGALNGCLSLLVLMGRGDIGRGALNGCLSLLVLMGRGYIGRGALNGCLSLLVLVKCDCHLNDVEFHHR